MTPPEVSSGRDGAIIFRAPSARDFFRPRLRRGGTDNTSRGVIGSPDVLFWSFSSDNTSRGVIGQRVDDFFGSRGDIAMTPPEVTSPLKKNLLTVPLE